MNVIISNKNETMLGTLSIDVIKALNGVFSVDELSATFKNFFFNKMIIDITAIDGYEDINVIQRLSLNFDVSKIILLLDDSNKVNSPFYLSGLVSVGIYNFTKDVEYIPFLIDNPNSYKDVANFQKLNLTQKDFALNERNEKNHKGFIGQRVIGIKNLTPHAGSTTFTYLLKNHLERLYKVKAVEINKNDFVYFNDPKLDKTTDFELSSYLNEHTDYEVVLIDVTNDNALNYCTDVLYLIEPGLIQLNRLIRENYRIFEELENKKIILNRSVLSSGDVSDFEREAKTKVFFNIPNVDDKSSNIKEINSLLSALGFTRFKTDGSTNGLNFFK